MAEIRFTKNELRDQQVKLAQLERYLPTLQLKKAMLQAQANEVRIERLHIEQKLEVCHQKVMSLESLLHDDLGMDVADLAKVTTVKKSYENIAGVEIPTFEGVSFKQVSYSLFESPIWLDGGVTMLRDEATIRLQVEVIIEKQRAIEKELREVSIRVNLFEKVMIPRAKENIKVIKIFLGDQQLAAVARAKVAKAKIAAKRVKRES